MASKRVRTKHPGIFKRGSSYELIYRDCEGKQRHETASTLREAINLRAKRLAEVSEGALSFSPKISLASYVIDWVETYEGRGSRGFRETTRKDYRRDLNRYVIPFFSNQKLGEISPRDISRFVAHLCNAQVQGRYLADSTVRRILSPLRAAFATAVREGLVRHNPTANVSLPARDHQRAIDNGTDYLEPETRKALSTDQLMTFLRICPDRWCLFFKFMAATGMRVSESIATRWLDLQLDGSTPHVHVRRAYVRGQFGPPKSKYGNRKIPIDHHLVAELRARRATTEWCAAEDLVFPAENGQPLHQENLRRRVLKPTAEEAGVAWAAFHTFRHTCATRLFAAGRNPTQVQRWLGHHSPSFTLSVYVHLLDDNLGEPLGLPDPSAPERSALASSLETETQHLIAKAWPE